MNVIINTVFFTYSKNHLSYNKELESVTELSATWWLPLLWGNKGGAEQRERHRMEHLHAFTLVVQLLIKIVFSTLRDCTESYDAQDRKVQCSEFLLWVLPLSQLWWVYVLKVGIKRRALGGVHSNPPVIGPANVSVELTELITAYPVCDKMEEAPCRPQTMTAPSTRRWLIR